MEKLVTIVSYQLISRIFTIGCLFFLSFHFGYSQNNNVKATVLTDWKYSFEYERFFSSKISFTVGYRRNNTFYETSGSNIFYRSAKGENHGNRVLVSIRFNLLPFINFKNPFKPLLKGKSYHNIKSSNISDRLYVAPIFSYGNHQFEYCQGSFIELPNGGMVKSKLNSDLRAYGIGLNLGYNRIWKHFNIDFGFNLTYNSVLGNSTGIEYYDGEIQEFPSDLNGLKPEAYFGIGYTF